MNIDEKEDVDYTTSGLRRALIDEINGLRGGTTTLAKAKAVSDLAKQVFNICKLESDILMANAKGLKQIAVPLVQGALELPAAQPPPTPTSTTET